MSDARVLSTAIKVDSDKREEKFSIQAAQVLFDGFLKLYMEGTDDENGPEEETVLPPVSVGDVLDAKGITAECKFTQPPQRYSEATLVKKLEELGIGRPSTYAPTISTLTTGRGYIVKGDKEGQKFPVTNLALKNGTISESRKTEAVGAEKGKLLPQEIGLIVTDYLEKNFTDIMDYDFTANVEKDFDQIADGDKVWNSVIGEFYSPFHHKVEDVLGDRQYSKVSREIGVDPSDGQMVVARFGQYGPYVQKGEGENRQFASLDKGQLIETITLEDALKLFRLPRRVGTFEDQDIIAMKGRYGPYIKHGDRIVSLPKGADPLKVSLDECVRIIAEDRKKVPLNAVLLEFADSGISVLNGRYGPYIKKDGTNYRIPKGTDASTLTEAACMAIINNSKPSEKTFRRGKKS